jgi:tetratricopeptide (TPR) repeat protein
MRCKKPWFFLFMSTLSTVLFILTEPVSTIAQTAQEIAWCEGKDGASADQRIQGCTSLIQSGRFKEKSLALAFKFRGNAFLYSKGSNFEVDPAIRDYSEAIRLNPQDASAFYARGDAYKAKSAKSTGNDTKQFAALAIKDFSENIRLNPKPKPLDYINRSNAYKLNGDNERALGDLKEALRLDPSDKAEALVNRCRLYAVLGRWPESLADCNESLKLSNSAGQDPDRGPDSLRARGFSYLKMGKYKESIADYDTVLQLSKMSDSYRSETLFGRGLAKLKSGDVTGGNADIAAGKQLRPNVVEQFTRDGVI